MTTTSAPALPRSFAALLVCALVSVLAVLVPWLVATSGELPGAIGLLAAATLAGLLHRGGARARVVGGPVAVTAARRSLDRRPALPGRVTDPAHHPLRPRAPGPA